MIYKNYFKRPLDFILALLGLIVLSPLLLITIIVLTISFRENPFFTQKRPGKKEKIFSVLKLKTMTNEKDASGNLLPDKDRLTPMGIFIRKTSIDELPQLINVLKGDMSLIGPRPLLIRYLPYYTEEEKKRFLIRPGITGLAQVSGRNFIGWDEKFAKDIEYYENLTFTTDIKIFWLTLKKVVSSDDIDVDPTSNPYIKFLDIERSSWEQFKYIKKL